MKIAIFVIFIVAAVSGVTTSNIRRGRYEKGDIPLLLIRPKEQTNKQPGSIRINTHSTLGGKPEDPSGSYSETSYIYKTNDESLSFTELLPKLGLTTSLFGLPSVHNSGGVSASASLPNLQQHQSKLSFPSQSFAAANPYYVNKVQTAGATASAASPESFKPSFPEFHSQSHGSYQQQSVGYQQQKVTVKSPLHTQIQGDTSYQPSTKTRTVTLTYSAPKAVVKSFARPTKVPTYRNPSPSLSNGPHAIVDEVVVGKPLDNIRPILPQKRLQQQQPPKSELVDDHNQDNGPTFQSLRQIIQYEPKPQQQPQRSTQAQHSVPQIPYIPPESVIQGGESDHKFGHITTNYYIPHTIQSEAEHKELKKPFTPSPQVEYFVSKSSHETNQVSVQGDNKFRNHYIPAHPQEEALVSYSTEAPQTDDYFLPRLQPTISPSPAVAQGHADTLVYQENPSFTSYFKFGTNLGEANKVEPSFPKFQGKLNFGSHFKSIGLPLAADEKPTAAKTYYTIKEEPLAYNPYKSPPVTKTFYPNQEPQKPTVIHREFTSKAEAQNFVKSQIRQAAAPTLEIHQQQRPVKFTYLPTPATVPETTTTVGLPETVYIKSNFPEDHFQQKFPAYDVRPVVEVPQSNEITAVINESQQYLLPDVPLIFENSISGNVGVAGHPLTRSSSVQHPPLEFKQTIASKKQDTAAAEGNIFGLASEGSQAREDASTTITTNSNNNPSNHQSNNHQQLSSRPHNHRRRQPNRKHALNSTPSESSVSETTTEPVSERMSATTEQQRQQQRRRRVNPQRQKIISCERQCIQNSVSQDYDPVCGNDGKTYSNKGKLTCTQKCGKEDLEVSHAGSCIASR